MVLVTGGTGFIGRRLVNGLEASGADCILLSRDAVKGHKTIVYDLLKDRINKDDLNGVETIFHLAGYAHDISSNNNDCLYQALNVDATTHLAELAGSSGVKSFIFISSVKAGGFDKDILLNEETQLEPEGIYGKTKREAELRLLEIGKNYNMHVAILRPSLVYGPGVKGNLKLMISGVKKGWIPPLPEIGNRRSMIHVDDLVEAILLVATNKTSNGEIFIATDGNSYSARKIYDAMCKISGKSVSNWSIPYVFFYIIGKLNGRLRFKFQKLFGDEYYSSGKLHSIGFEAKRKLEEMNETSF